MVCPKCGVKLPDGSKFCSACGEKLTDAVPEVQEEKKAEDVSASAAPAAPINSPKPEFVQPKKKVDSKKVIAVAIVSIIAIVVIWGLKALFSGMSGNAYVYLSGGKYELITNLNKDQTIEIASSRSSAMGDDLLAFSPDGKYIYYYTKYDTNSEAGTLCRAEYGKLKEKSNKNDKYIEIIASNVSRGFRLLKDGSVIYKNNDNTLYYFNGKESVQITKKVYDYYTDESGKLVYLSGDRSEGYTLYGMKLADIDNKIKLASNIYYVHSATDFENILYIKREDDDRQTLYVVGFSKEEEKLAENVNILARFDNKTYFTAANGAKLSLYDYVEDSYAVSDAGITQPDRADFSTPEYSYRMVYGSDLTESDLGELYTTCTKELYWYGTWTWYHSSMEEAAVERYFGGYSKDIRVATQSFIDRFADTADENGFILVTDEVKDALKEIQKYADQPEEEWQWMWLCYEKYQSGTNLDYDAYRAACDRWDEAKDRISVREVLQNKENDYTVNTLYCFEKGTLTAVNENVLKSLRYDGAIIFNTTDLITKKIKIEDVSSTYDVMKMFWIDYTADNHIILSDGTSCSMSKLAREDLEEAVSPSLRFTNKEVYMINDNDTLFRAAIRDGVVGDFSVVTDDVVFLTMDGSTLYYISEYYEKGDTVYCNLYSCDRGTVTCLAKDVVFENINLYSDGTILAYTGYRKLSGYELTMINKKGESTLIADGVRAYVRVDKSNLLYISDGDLYSYNGKEKKKVRSNVSWIWSRKSMEIDNTFDIYYYFDYGDIY